MMMFAAAATMRWIMIGRMVVGMVGMAAAGIARMTCIARVIIGCDRMDPPGRSCHRRWSIPALGIEARPANGIHGRCSRMPAIGGRKLVAVQAGGMVVVELL